jgi:hypothetical protein
MEFLVRQWFSAVVMTEAPALMKAALGYGESWHPLLRWVAENILRLGEPLVFRPSGSGDGAWN